MVTALADHIAAHALSGWPWACLCGGWSSDPESGLPDRGTAQTVRAAHAAHVAETWAEHRTVTTLDQLRELPDYVVIADAGGAPWTRGAFGWRSSGLERGHSSIRLPATILHHPEEDQ